MFTTKAGCPACAKTIERDATTCPHCGHRLAAEAPAATAPEATGRRPQEFELSDVPSAGLLRRLSGRVPREHVFVELRNLLATTAFHDVRESDVAAILAKGRLLPREVNDQLTAIYEQAAHLKAFDGTLDEVDRRGLQALKVAFELTDAEADAALERAVSDVYEYVITDALVDDRFTATERARLESIAQGLALPDALRDQLYAKAAKQSLQRVFSAAISDGRYSGHEEQALQELATSLNVKMTHDADTTALIERLRLLGRIVDGHLPEELVAITLKRRETCHFVAEGVTHKELRTVTKRVNYGGPTASIKIMKGVRWRMGSVAVERVSEDILTPLDTVTFYLTSSRVFLQGERKNTTVAFSKIAHFTLYKDGLQIEKDTGRDIYLTGGADWELAAACLGALLQNDD
jgi:hypothetical protein